MSSEDKEGKGFIHIYDVDDELDKAFREFARTHSGNRLNSALHYLLEFYNTFKDVIKILKGEK